jgi:predicted neuraminidase
LFGSEVDTGPYKHPGSITELANGDLYVAFFSGDGEYQDAQAAVYGSRLKKGNRRWSRPERIASNPFYALGNPVVWEAPDGVVWLFYVTRHGDLWDTSRISGKISRDQAKTWSESFQVTFEPGTMTRSRPVVLPDGHYLLPIYHEVGNDTESVGPDCTSLFLRFDPVTRLWSESNRVRSRLGNIQPAAAWIQDQQLVAFCRRGGDYEGRPDGWMVRTESNDGGRTWSEGEDTDLPNPNAAVDFIRLQSGNHLLVYNPSFSDRTPLTVALSVDGAKSFPYRRNLMAGPNESYAYPTAIQLRNGKIQVLFTSDERTTLRRAIFEETALTKSP